MAVDAFWIRVVLLSLTASLLGCVGFRENFPPAREGSMSNRVEYAYFTTRLERPYGWYFKPLGYREFNVDTDEQVVFVCSLHNPGPAYVLRGVLRRPDSAEHGVFRREIGTSHPLQRSMYFGSEAFAMKDLKAFPGDWTLELFANEEPLGAFVFFLGDAPAITRARQRRLE